MPFDPTLAAIRFGMGLSPVIAPPASVADMMAQLRENISIPIGVGFGIRDGETAKAVSELADAVVVGSRIIEEIEQSPKADILSNVGRLISTLRHAIDEK